jgi:hypothetical protein
VKLAFFEGSQMLGVGYINVPRSSHYYCPVCGEAWGTELVLNPEASNQTHYHQYFAVNCPEHAHLVKWLSLPLFSQIYEPHWIGKRIPREVLVRDFLFLDDLIQREESCQS